MYQLSGFFNTNYTYMQINVLQFATKLHQNPCMFHKEVQEKGGYFLTLDTGLQDGVLKHEQCAILYYCYKYKYSISLTT
jgi:hypothetical protein